jgi:hypothetical protein
MTRLAQLDQQAEAERVYGKVCVEITYQHGHADRVRTVIETHHK